MSFNKNRSFEIFFIFIPTESFWTFYFYFLLLAYIVQELSREPEKVV